MLKFIVSLALVTLLGGCSVHKVWNGDKKPGLSYISIDHSGNVVSNNKSVANLFDAIEQFKKEGDSNDHLGNVVSNNKSVANLFDAIEQFKKEGDSKALSEFLAKNAGRMTLFIWSAEYNGAMINGKGNTCLQAATYARSTKITADISSSLLSALGKIDLSNASEADKLLATTITETITKLNEPSTQSTYLSAGLFGLCVLHANGGLTPQQVKDATIKLIESSSLKDAK